MGFTMLTIVDVNSGTISFHENLKTRYSQAVRHPRRPCPLSRAPHRLLRHSKILAVKEVNRPCRLGCSIHQCFSQIDSQRGYFVPYVIRQGRNFFVYPLCSVCSCSGPLRMKLVPHAIPYVCNGFPLSYAFP